MLTSAQVWHGENGEPAPTQAYFWITAPSALGVAPFNIGPDGIARQVPEGTPATPIDLSVGSFQFTPNYTDYMTSRAASAVQVRLLVTSGDLSSHEFVGSKGDAYVTRPLMITGESPDGAGVNASLTETNTMPIVTDSRGGLIQHQEGAEKHVTGTVDAKSAAGPAAVPALVLAFGAAAVALLA